MKLHLGCGQKYLKGYVNIDFPISEHPTHTNSVADKFADITQLNYSENSLEEIRLHHVFEHFPRHVALAQLCRWRNWLVQGGLLRIETPDIMASARQLTNPLISYANKQQVLRHLFGSHEAKWAVHFDGWYKQKFIFILESLGYGNLKFNTNSWGYTRNIEVVAYKDNRIFDKEKFYSVVTTLLSYSTIKVKVKKNVPPENNLMQFWLSEWNRFYEMG